MASAKIEIEPIIHSFVESVVAIVQSQMAKRVHDAISTAFAGSVPRPKTASAGVRLAPVKPTPAKPISKKGRKLNLSPEAIAVRRRQAKYMSIIKPLSATNRERVKKVAHEKGVTAAIRFAGTL